MSQIIIYGAKVAAASWELLLQASPYILFGIVVGGLLKMFLSPEYVVKHLGRGRYSSVVKAALFGIPIPLCSCGVLPAAASLKKQGANNGATAAFLISTPESGVDSISITYALLDPLMTLARPLAAFLTALTAGFAENYFNPPVSDGAGNGLGSCQLDNCCDGSDCTPATHQKHHSFLERIGFGCRYAITDIWGDLAVWFFIGIVVAGVISTAVPDDYITLYLGGGLGAMLLMLVVGIPLYICATASTPIAAALILKGVSPGVALVFLLVGPATNITSLSVLVGLLGKRATALYVSSIAVVSVLCGLGLDMVYGSLGISAQAVAGQAAEIVPYWLQLGSTLLLFAFSVQPLSLFIAGLWRRLRREEQNSGGCGCQGSSCEIAQGDLQDIQEAKGKECGCGSLCGH